MFASFNDGSYSNRAIGPYQVGDIYRLVASNAERSIYRESSGVYISRNITIQSYEFTTKTTALLFAENGNTAHGGIYPGYLRIFSCQIIDTQTGKLRLDMIPVRVGSVGYMYDKVSGRLFGNAGTGDFVLGPDIVEVEYLESTGDNTELGPYVLSQYDIVAGNVFQMEAAFPSNLGSKVVVGRNASNNECFIRFSGQGYFGGGSFDMGTSLSTNTKYTLRFDLTAGDMKFTVDDTIVKTSTNTQPSRGKFPLFVTAALAQNTLNTNVNVRIYCFKVWNSGNLVEDLVPVIVGGEGAMMDRLTRKIYRNAGTGAFITGPVVNASSGGGL